MTPEQIVDSICNLPLDGTQRDRIREIISTAILSERQSIALVLTQEADKIEESSGPKAYRVPSSEVARLRNLARLILEPPNPPTP